MATPRICSIPGCGNPHAARDLCTRHYSNLRRHGDPNVVKRTRWGVVGLHLKESLKAPSRDDCLIWPYAKNSAGYGQIRQGGKIQYVHRIACEQANGAPPTPRHEAAHICGNGHLVWKTHYQNHQDRHAHGTMIQGSAHSFAKLSESQIPEIRRMSQESGVTEVARLYGVSTETIRDVWLGKTWKHVD